MGLLLHKGEIAMAATKNAQAVKSDTKEFITTALLVLLKTQDFADISVSAVMKKAGLSRMAFYRNYDTLAQVLYEYYENKIGSVFENMRETAEPAGRMGAHMYFFENYGADMLLSIKRGFEPIVHEVFTKQVEKFHGDSHDGYHISFIAAGAYAVWRRWLLDGSKKPLAEVMETIGVFSRVLKEK